MKNSHYLWCIVLLLSGLILIAGCNKKPTEPESPSWTTLECGTNSGTGCAPSNQRVDLIKPTFSKPTNITNSLFPVSKVPQTLLLGHVEGKPLHVLYTLLPGTKTIAWEGQQIETLIVQYLAHLDGRIKEVALDWYAQADDGAVWYFGEDVFNYEAGVVVDTDGTWLGGEDGPIAMIMPASPKVGDVYRVENIPGLVFEEITVKATAQTVDGPSGPVNGAIVVKQLHVDGSFSDKTLAPGYGEFYTATETDLEALALAVPIDALSLPAPIEFETIFTNAIRILDTAKSGNWTTTSDLLKTMTDAWAPFRMGGNVPKLLAAQMSGVLDALARAVGARKPAEVCHAAIVVAEASLDLQLRHRPPVEIDLARFDLWVRQFLIDSEFGDYAAAKGDLATLEWTLDRLDNSNRGQIKIHLRDLRAAADSGNRAAASDVAERLRDLLVRLKK